MKRILSFLLVTILSVVSHIPMFADGIPAPGTGGNTGNNSGNENIIILYPKKPGGRPKVPGKVFIECNFIDANLYFSFPDDTVWIEVTMEDESGSVLLIQTVCSEDEGVYIPLSEGTFTITARISTGGLFSGILEL